MFTHTAVLYGIILLVAPGASGALAAQAPQQAAGAKSPTHEVAVAWLDLQRIVETSAEGKIANAKVQALTQKKTSEIADKQKQLQAAQLKLQTGGTVLNDAARVQLEKEIDRLNVDIQRMQQDAQADIQDLQNELQNEFQKKLMPVIEALVKERDIAMLFSRNDAGIVYGDPLLDLTAEIIKRFDAMSATPTAAPAPSAAPKPPAAGQPAAPASGTPPGR
jgi:outer membrane protein